MATVAQLVHGTEVRNWDTDLGVIYIEDGTEMIKFDETPKGEIIKGTDEWPLTWTLGNSKI